MLRTRRTFINSQSSTHANNSIVKEVNKQECQSEQTTDKITLRDDNSDDMLKRTLNKDMEIISQCMYKNKDSLMNKSTPLPTYDHCETGQSVSEIRAATKREKSCEKSGTDAVFTNILRTFEDRCTDGCGDQNQTRAGEEKIEEAASEDSLSVSRAKFCDLKVSDHCTQDENSSAHAILESESSEGRATNVFLNAPFSNTCEEDSGFTTPTSELLKNTDWEKDAMFDQVKIIAHELEHDGKTISILCATEWLSQSEGESVHADGSGNEDSEGNICNNAPNSPDSLIETPADTDVVNHRSLVGEYFRDLYNQEKIVDVLIHVQDKTFPAHRVPLACHSQYFADIFLDQSLTQTLPIELRVDGIGPDLFASFLTYVYNGNVTLSSENVGDMALICEILTVPRLFEVCSEYLENLPLDQALVAIVSGHTDCKLLSKSFQLVLENLYSLMQSNVFWNIDIESVERILSHNGLQVVKEMDVFKAGLQWVLYDLEQREVYVDRVMRCVRFALLSSEELYRCLSTSDIVRRSKYCIQVILEANWIASMRYSDLDDPLELELPSERIRVESIDVGEVQQDSEKVPDEEITDQHNNNHDDFTSVSPIPSEDASQLMSSEQEFYEDFYDDTEEGTSDVIKRALVTKSNRAEENLGRTEKSRRMSEPFEEAAVHFDMKNVGAKPIVMEKDIIAVGGIDETKQAKQQEAKNVERYHTIKNNWGHYTSLPESRHHHAVAVLNGKVYVIGGSQPNKPKKSSSPVASTYRFDTETKQWKEVDPLNTARMFHSVCSLYGMIYAMGGQDEKNSVLNTVECYNPITDTWTEVAPMLHARFGFGAASLGGRIYVAGGCGEMTTKQGITILDSVECFSPRSNRWEEKPRLEKPLCYLSLVNVCANLYLCGGASYSDQSALQSVAEVRTYSRVTGEWTHKTDMAIPRHNAGATVIGTKFYLIGGFSTAKNQILQSIECYDTYTDTWDTDLQEIPYPAKWLSCVTLPSSN